VDRIVHRLVSELRGLIATLGADGGLIGPSVYDTAQVLRFAPPADPAPALDWLLDQQQADGGWGDPAVPLARAVPTLAALLALHAHRPDAEARQGAGLAFLRGQAPRWAGPPPEDIPIAAELILPRLLDDARAAGLEVDDRPYSELRALGQRRRRMIAALPPRAGITAAHCWESWGDTPHPALLDPAGSVGHSPAATAAWLHAARACPELADHCALAQRCLDGAAAATGLGLPGVAPTVWPYPRNEQIVSLYALLLAGLFDDPALRDAILPQVDDLRRSLRPNGQGISDWFQPDGDNTAMSLAVIAATGQPADKGMLAHYLRDTFCITYPQELQRSHSATAHAAHALALLGGEPAPLLRSLEERRAVDGRWHGEKWHGSWLYLTSHTICALVAAGRLASARSAGEALLAHQGKSGRWGDTAAAAEETGYAVTALLALERAGASPAGGRAALDHAGWWLLRHAAFEAADGGACWIGKELYRPRRIARIIELGAALAWVRWSETAASHRRAGAAAEHGSDYTAVTLQ
jgi:halimadienyl-diphosphate synthase